jgi:WD40 repeat protein
VTVRLVAAPSGHTRCIRWAEFSPDGNRIVTAGYDPIGAGVERGQGTTVATLAGHAKTVNQAMLPPDGQRIVTAKIAVPKSQFRQAIQSGNAVRDIPGGDAS